MIHCYKDYDERYNCITPLNKRNILTIIQALLRMRKVEYEWYMVPDAKLRKYATQKKDRDQERWRRPAPEWLVHDHLEPDEIVF